MTNYVDAFYVVFQEFYFFVTVAIMWLIHVGFSMYEVGVSRRKNMMHTLSKNLMLIPIITMSFFFFGWWSYFAFVEFPFGPIAEAPWALPWSTLMGPNFGAVGDPDGWARLNGVFAMAFLLFAWTTGSICSGAMIERIRLGSFLVLMAVFGGWWWLVDAAWGWAPNGWMVQLMGYHDAYAAGVVHVAAGGFALGVLYVLKPRIGKFGPNGEVRDISPHNKWITCFGLILILTGFWGFMAACHVPLTEMTGDPENPFWSATTIYGTPVTLSNLTVTYIMACAAGMMAMFFMSKGDPFWTMSGMISGVVSNTSGMDVYHPLTVVGLAFMGSVFAYKMHYWVERRFKIDDAVGAVAVHAYAGLFSMIACGFIMWGYPAAAPIVENGAWFANNADGWPTVQPLGQAIGAVIMFGLFGIIPGYVLAKSFDIFGKLRVPREVELAGQDSHFLGDAYPYFEVAETEFEAIERTYMRDES
ncbi:MAG: ammonium transporter [Alphaproteobacteria bacterium]